MLRWLMGKPEKKPEELALETAVAKAKKLIDQAVSLDPTTSPRWREILERNLDLQARFGEQCVISFNKDLGEQIKEIESKKSLAQAKVDLQRVEQEAEEKRKKYDQKIKTLSEKLSDRSPEQLKESIDNLKHEYSTLQQKYQERLGKLAENQQKEYGELILSLREEPTSFSKIANDIFDEHRQWTDIQDKIKKPVSHEGLSYGTAWLTCLLEKERQLLDQMSKETGLWLDDAIAAAAQPEEEEKATEQQRPARTSSNETQSASVVVHLETTGTPSVSGFLGTQVQQPQLPVQPRVEAVIPHLTLGASRIN